MGPGLPGSPALDARSAEISSEVRAAIGAKYPIEVETIPGANFRLQAHLTLSDGTPLTIDVNPGRRHAAGRLAALCACRAAGLAGALQLGCRPSGNSPSRQSRTSRRHARPEREDPRLSETGPSEVAYAATAFNAMRERIAQYLEERVQILAAISHDPANADHPHEAQGGDGGGFRRSG